MRMLLAVVALIALFGVMGTMDYHDAVKEADHYAAMVCDGIWPNYKGVEVDCSGSNRAHFRDIKEQEGNR